MKLDQVSLENIYKEPTMKSPSQYHIQKRKDCRHAVTVMFNGKRQTIYGKTKKETLEKLTRAIDEIQYVKIHKFPVNQVFLCFRGVFRYMRCLYRVLPKP